MRPFYHVPYAAFASNWLTTPSGCLVGLLTTRGALNQPFRGVTKITTDRLRQRTKVSSIIRHLFATGRPSSCTTVT